MMVEKKQDEVVGGVVNKIEGPFVEVFSKQSNCVVKSADPFFEYRFKNSDEGVLVLESHADKILKNNLFYRKISLKKLVSDVTSVLSKRSLVVEAVEQEKVVEDKVLPPAFDINKDGVVDEKDASLAGKVLSGFNKRKKKVVKNKTAKKTVENEDFEKKSQKTEKKEEKKEVKTVSAEDRKKWLMERIKKKQNNKNRGEN